jgi:hypothetical protein
LENGNHPETIVELSRKIELEPGAASLFVRRTA